MYNTIIILGPTASGKTDISINLAKRLNTEVINADCMQIYKELTIGTAKATPEEQDGVKHHLLDFVDPTSEFSVTDYKEKAMPIITDLISQNKIPVIVGGTGFYVQSLLTNYDYGNSFKSEKLRAELNQLAEEKGKTAVHDILKSIDIESANRIHENDLKRVIRAIEIYKLSGTKKSEINNTMQTDMQNPIKPLIIVLDRDREELYNRINLRVDLMNKAGLIDEVKMLVKKYNLSIDNQCMQGIGYKEVLEYLDDQISLEECLDKIKINTRHYAKRQLTWFKHQVDGIWINLSKTNKNEAVDQIISYLK
ncbi:MAG: tRNA (adenosine(37)-N6)-dimethylallyltransferase MiaA [Clostridia bacterium]|nr:tRNA (adenosine(37)-N6)-dimethylallyltransferase MiaA [Clostridia bacterium]